MADLTSNQLCNICRISYNSGLRCCALGSSVEGGRLICKEGGVAWIVAPSSTQVSRNWYSRNDAVTLAQAAAPCGDWYIPSRVEGVMLRDTFSFWDSSCSFWVSNCWGYSAITAYSFVYGGVAFGNYTNKNTSINTRAFRKVFY